MKICRRYKSLIASYVDHTATAEERTALDRHLSVCPACARETRELVRTRRLVTSLPALQPSRQLLSAISARLRETRVGWLERLWWSFRPADWRLPATAAILVLCIAVGIAALHGPMGSSNRPDEQLYVAQPHAQPPEIVSESPRDDYVTSCVLIHESFDHNRVFGTPDEVQLVSYGQ